VDHFITGMNKKTGKVVTGLSKAALRIFMAYPWPGNVRELENAIEHAFVLCDRKMIDSADLPMELRRPDYTIYSNTHLAAAFPPKKRRQKISKETLLELLDECDWNKAEVGRRIGLSRTAIWKYMKKWHIPLQKK
jgi:transcriptional regulator with PAS, ATPase and Fis domain